MAYRRRSTGVAGGRRVIFLSGDDAPAKAAVVELFDAADRRERMMRADLARVLVGLLGLVDRQLGSRVGLETIVGNRPTTPDRSAERPRVESRLSSSERRQPIPKFSGNGIVGVLGGE